MVVEDQKRFLLKDAVYMIIAACIAHNLAVQAGVNLAYSTILLPQIMEKNTTKLDSNWTEFEINLKDNEQYNANVTEADAEVSYELSVDKHQATWIASLVTITTPIGSLIAGPLMDKYGRRNVCFLTSVPFIISWAMVAVTTTSVYMLYVARVLAGVGGGLSTVALVYVSEISHPTVRPMLLSISSVFVSFGILLTTILGYYMTWRTVALTFCLLSVLSLLLVFIIPESPPWMCSRNIREQSSLTNDVGIQDSLRWFYRTPEHYDREYTSLLKMSQEKKEQLLESQDRRQTERKKPVYKQILTLVTLFILQQCSGCYVIIFYAVKIFQDIGGSFGSGLNEFSAVVILGLIRFFMSICTVFLSKKFGRRTLLTVSGVGMTVSNLSCAMYLCFFGVGIAPVILLLSYVLFSALGYLIIPWTLIGELLPLRIRGTGSGAMISAAYILMFINVKLFVYAIDYFGNSNVFVFFGVVTLVGLVFVYYKVPETLGKTFTEIEDYFKY